jgi:Gpi18-like mannosyltransferase
VRSTGRPSVTGSPAASEALTPAGAHPETISGTRWRPVDWAWFAAILIVGIAIRVVLLPTDGLRDDLDQFVGWVHHIATNGLGTLYGETAAGLVTFGPVMGYVWAGLAALDPGFGTAVDASDASIRVLMKLPAVVADVGLALLVAYALRDRPRWAVAGAATILLHPAVIDVSAWWGQYEPVYLLPALAATILAINGRNGWAAAAIAVSVLTKPQALPLLLPFAAWFLAAGYRRDGVRGAVLEALRTGVVGVVVMGLLWLPFVGHNGPLNYLGNLSEYQGEILNYLSLRAWNMWWLIQGLAAGGFVHDDLTILGPVSFRHIGYALALVLNGAIAVVVFRSPHPRTLILGLAASVLVFFAFATQMHERYAYGAVILIALLIAEPAARWLGIALGVVFTANLLAAIPPTPEIGSLLPVTGLLGVAGSIAMLAITYAALRLLVAAPPGRAAVPVPRGP